jgi:hypothetical protein
LKGGACKSRKIIFQKAKKFTSKNHKKKVVKKKVIKNYFITTLNPAITPGQAIAGSHLKKGDNR